MGAYAYKYVRDVVPEFVTKAIPDYEGAADYDGDLWSATRDYIDALEQEIAFQFSRSGALENDKLEAWLKTREKTFYCDGPAILPQEQP